MVKFKANLSQNFSLDLFSKKDKISSVVKHFCLACLSEAYVQSLTLLPFDFYNFVKNQPKALNIRSENFIFNCWHFVTKKYCHVFLLSATVAGRANKKIAKILL